MTGALVVRIADAAVGRLWLDERKRFCSQYDPLWVERSRIPLSLSLPLRLAPYLDDESHLSKR
jgi:serine/threonine-protein kinase HipA